MLGIFATFALAQPHLVMGRPRSTIAFAFALMASSASVTALEYYSTQDGSWNNIQHPDWGVAGSAYVSPPSRSYEDGLGEMRQGLPSPRAISALIGKQSTSSATSSHTVAMLAWGQVIAHDMGELRSSAESAPILVPTCDSTLDPDCQGGATIAFNRGLYDQDIGSTSTAPRQILNFATSFIDASWLYGMTTEREGFGGKLRLPDYDFPYVQLAAQGSSGCRRPQVADRRANENPGLQYLYLVFAREHNRIASELAASEATWDDEKLYQEARMRTIALVQKITAEEYAPALLGTTFKGQGQYDPTAHPGTSLLFSVVAYRYGHSGVPSWYRYGNQSFGLRDWQNPCLMMLDSDLVVRGLLETPINQVDTKFITDVRDFLRTEATWEPGDKDLLAINIQRGRDVGIPSYNKVRELLGLSKLTSFEDMVAGTGANATLLKELYHDVDLVDAYVGGLMERKEIETKGTGSEELGETFAAIIREQFTRSRAADRFWYEWVPELAAFVQNRGLKQIVEDNTVGGEIVGAPFVFDAGFVSTAAPLPKALGGYSSHDGAGNNVQNPRLGSSGDVYISPSQRSYKDGRGAMRMDLPSPRAVSNVIGRQLGTNTQSSRSATMLAWGQSVAHDLGQLDGNASDLAPIMVPDCDIWFDPGCQGGQSIPFQRGQHKVPGMGGAREIFNFATSFIDASWLYGEATVREYAGGRLQLPGNIFPDWGPNSAPQGSPQCRKAKVADPRASENVALQYFYLLFAREHNRISRRLESVHRSWDDEKLYQEARMRNIALIQKITSEEYAPVLLGTTFKGQGQYDSSIDPRVSLLFSMAAYRYGHSAIPGSYRYGNESFMFRDWQFPLCAQMLNSDLVVRGLPETPINSVDGQFVNDVRDHLKTDMTPNAAEHDLFARNLQRGRDVGLPSYNNVRAMFGFTPVSTFEAMAPGSRAAAAALKELYGNVDEVDFYVGGLFERKEIETRGSGSEELGETFAAVIREQFNRTRLGDRFWYEWVPELASFVQGRGLKQVMEDNTYGGEVPAQPFMFNPPTKTPAQNPAPAPGPSAPSQAVFALSKIGMSMKTTLLDGDTLEVELSGPRGNNQWISVGFGPSSSSMAGADYLVVSFGEDGSRCEIGDYFGAAHAVPPTRDAGEASFDNTSCEVSNGMVVATAIRPLGAGDGEDVGINTEGQPYIYAAGASQWPGYHGSARSGGTLALSRRDPDPTSTGAPTPMTSRSPTTAPTPALTPNPSGASIPLSAIGCELKAKVLPDGDLELELTGSTSNYKWISVGFGPSSTSMADVDYIVVDLSASGGCEVGDFWGEAHAVEPLRDSGPPSFQAVCEINGGVVTASVVRPLTATDGQDVAVDSMSQSFLFAAGTSAWPGYHGSHRGGGTVSIATGAVTVADTSINDKILALKTLHALTMTIMFSVGWPTAIICVMFLRHTRWGFRLHKLIGQTGVGAVLVAGLLGSFTAASPSSHGALGYFIVISTLVISALGNFLEANFSSLRTFLGCGLRLVHKTLGYIVLLTAPVTMWLGFRLLVPFDSISFHSTPVLWYLPISSIVIAVGIERARRYHAKEMTWSELTQRIRAGEQLLVIRGLVIDVSTWGASHPGGLEVLTALVGQDATDVFEGNVAYTDTHGFARKYFHSSKAMDTLLKVAIGKLVTAMTPGQETSASDDAKALDVVGGNDESIYSMRVVSAEAINNEGNVRKFVFATNSPVISSHSISLIQPGTNIQREYSPLFMELVGSKLHVTFMIKIYPKGQMTQWLRTLSKGDVALVKQTNGQTLQSPTEHGCWQFILMLAAGTGITPMLRVLNDHIEQTDNPRLKHMRLCMVWWISCEDEAFIGIDDFKQIQKALNGRFHLRVHFTRASEDDLKASAWKSTSFSVCTGRDTEGAMRWSRDQFAQKDASIPLDDNSILGLICGPDKFVRETYRMAKVNILSMSDRFLVL